MRTFFPYEDRKSKLFGTIKRPYAKVSVWSKSFNNWIDHAMLIDTGADYTLFPHSAAEDLGVDLEQECEKYETKGVGGKEVVFILKEKLAVQLGEMKREIIAGFLSRDDLPPLLGRTECLDNFDVLFSGQKTYFDEIGKI